MGNLRWVLAAFMAASLVACGKPATNTTSVAGGAVQPAQPRQGEAASSQSNPVAQVDGKAMPAELLDGTTFASRGPFQCGDGRGEPVASASLCRMQFTDSDGAGANTEVGFAFFDSDGGPEAYVKRYEAQLGEPIRYHEGGMTVPVNGGTRLHFRCMRHAGERADDPAFCVYTLNPRLALIVTSGGNGSIPSDVAPNVVQHTEALALAAMRFAIDYAKLPVTPSPPES
jgi:hypothetical protein